MNPQPIPFQKRILLPLSPLVIRGFISVNNITNQLEIEYALGVRFFSSLRFPRSRMAIPIGSISQAKLKGRRLQLVGKSLNTFQFLGAGILDLKINKGAQKSAKGLLNDLNLRIEISQNWEALSTRRSEAATLH